MSERKPIVELFTAINEIQDPDFLVTERFKKARESWVLERFVKACELEPEVNYVECGEGPDFSLYNTDSARSWVCGVEVVEVMEPGRRRGDELRCRESAIDIEEPGEDYERDIVAHVKKELGKKFAMAYPRGTRLLVYLNLSRDLYFKFADAHTPTAFGIRVVKSVLKSLPIPTGSGISEIWLVRTTVPPVRVYPD